MVWHVQHAQKKLHQCIKRVPVDCRMEMGRRGRTMERPLALQVETNPHGMPGLSLGLCPSVRGRPAPGRSCFSLLVCRYFIPHYIAKHLWDCAGN